MSGKLSDRFAALQGTAGPHKAVKTSGADGRLSARLGTQKNARAATAQTKRGLTPQKNNNQTQKNTPRAKGVPGRASRPQKVGKKGAAAAGGKVNGNGKAPKKKPATAEDLDKEMDTYWFAAGKGPNPEVLSLDKEMDDYFKAKPAGAAETATEEVNMS